MWSKTFEIDYLLHMRRLTLEQINNELKFLNIFLNIAREEMIDLPINELNSLFIETQNVIDNVLEVRYNGDIRERSKQKSK